MLHVWDADSGDLVFTPPHFGTSAVYALAWSPQGRFLAVAGRGVEVYQWKRDDEWNKEWGLLLTRYEEHTDAVYALAWSPDGERIASSGFDKTVQIWRPDASRLLLTYADHLEYVRAVAWSPDGELIASASRDGTVQVWEADSGRLLATYREHNKPVYTVIWSPSAASGADLVEDALPEEDALPGEEEGGEEIAPTQTDPRSQSFSPPPYSLPRMPYSGDPPSVAHAGGDDLPRGSGPDRISGVPSVYGWMAPPSPFTPLPVGSSSSTKRQLQHPTTSYQTPRKGGRGLKALALTSGGLIALVVLLAVICLLIGLMLGLLQLLLVLLLSLVGAAFGA